MTNPVSLVVGLGTNGGFSVLAAGANLSYHWSHNGTALTNGGRIAGASSAVLSITSCQDADAGTYVCAIVGSISPATNTAPVTLTVIDPPALVTSPTNQAVGMGATATAAVHAAATGTGLSFTWQKNGTVVSGSTHYLGATNSDLVITNLGWTDSGSYAVTIANIAGTVTTAPATLVYTQAFDNFEEYNAGQLDSNGNANTQASNPWWGPAPPNGIVIGETQPDSLHVVVPHSRGDGSGNMVQSAASGTFEDTDDVNLAYRLNAGQSYNGNLKMDWWYFDPWGADGRGANLEDYMVIGHYGLPTDHDHDAMSFTGTKIIWLGAYPAAGYDPTLYQAKITGETDGLNAGQFYNTTRTRSIGWHHFRILVGIPNGASTPVSFFIDDMVNPVMTHAKFWPDSIDCAEINGRAHGSTSDPVGYFDHFSFQTAADPWIVEPPVSFAVSDGQPATMQIVANCTGYQWKKNGAVINGATDSAYNIASAGSGDAGSYTCVVTGAGGSVESSVGVLSLVPSLAGGTGLQGQYL